MHKLTGFVTSNDKFGLVIVTYCKAPTTLPYCVTSSEGFPLYYEIVLPRAPRVLAGLQSTILVLASKLAMYLL